MPRKDDSAPRPASRWARSRGIDRSPAEAGRALGRFIGDRLDRDWMRAQRKRAAVRLRPLGRAIDRIVTYMVVAIVLVYGVRLLWFVLTR